MKKGNSKFPNNLRPNSITMILIGLIVWSLIFSFLLPIFSGGGVSEVTYDKFWTMLEKGQVTYVELNDPLEFTIKEKDGTEKRYRTPYTNYGYDKDLIPKMKEVGGVSWKSQSSNVFTKVVIPYVLQILVFFGIIMLFSRFLTKRMGGNSMSFGKSNAKIYVQSKPGKRFDDVAGQDEAKEDLLEIVDFLHDPKKYTEIGAVLPKGVLLVGPPGPYLHKLLQERLMYRFSLCQDRNS